MKIIILLFAANVLFGYVDYQSNYLINNQKEGININTSNWGWYDQTGEWDFEFYQNMSYITYHSKHKISLQAWYIWDQYRDNSFAIEGMYSFPNLFNQNFLLNQTKVSYDSYDDLSVSTSFSFAAFKSDKVLFDITTAISYYFGYKIFPKYSMFSVEFSPLFIRPLRPYVSVWIRDKWSDNRAWFGFGASLPIEF